MSNNDCESYYEEPYAGKPHVRFCKGVHIARCGFTKRAQEREKGGLL